MLRRPLASLMAAAALSGLTAPGTAQPQPGAAGLPDSRRALDTLLARFVEAYNRKDAARLAALFTEDAVLVPSCRPAGNPMRPATFWPRGHGEMLMSASVEVAAAEREEAAETARAERAFVAVLAAVIALEGYALAWFLG